MPKTKPAPVTTADEMKITVIVSREVVDALDARAKAERRSRSSEAAVLLERALAAPPTG